MFSSRSAEFLETLEEYRPAFGVLANLSQNSILAAWPDLAEPNWDGGSEPYHHMIKKWRECDGDALMFFGRLDKGNRGVLTLYACEQAERNRAERESLASSTAIAVLHGCPLPYDIVWIVVSYLFTTKWDETVTPVWGRRLCNTSPHVGSIRYNGDVLRTLTAKLYDWSCGWSFFEEERLLRAVPDQSRTLEELETLICRQNYLELFFLGFSSNQRRWLCEHVIRW